MLREMGTFGAVMTVILLVLIAIKSILHYLKKIQKTSTICFWIFVDCNLNTWGIYHHVDKKSGTLSKNK